VNKLAFPSAPRLTRTGATNTYTQIDDKRKAPPRRRVGMWLLVVAAAFVFGSGAVLSYYVDALWFDSLGYASVFWTRLNLQAANFGAFALFTFLTIGGVFLAIRPRGFNEIIGGRIYINRQWVQIPMEPILNLLALALALVSALVVGASMMRNWTTLALFWHAPHETGLLDPIFGKPVGFYLFTLPAWQLIAGWLLTLATLA
jgi:uncharacterized protein